jgi:hypothetical protein
VTKDPASGNLKNPQSQDGYNYSNDNPINGTDPSGKQFLLSGVGGIFDFVNTLFTPVQSCPYGAGAEIRYIPTQSPGSSEKATIHAVEGQPVLSV